MVSSHTLSATILRLRHVLAGLRRRAASRLGKRSYAQTGEDLIMAFICADLGIRRPSYLDIGAHHPTYLSNTRYFHRRGSRGINIEPDPTLFAAFTRQRRRDTNLNIGIGGVADELDFHIMSTPTLNTFSTEAAQEAVNQGFTIVQTRPVTVRSVSQVLAEHWQGLFPDILSLDVEGLDYEILRGLDLSGSQPTVICVETISYSATGEGTKDLRIIDLLEQQGYLVFADTYVNTIFVRRDRWVRTSA